MNIKKIMDLEKTTGLDLNDQKRSKSGMYGEREKITIGKYTIAAMSDNPDDGVWIQDNEADDGGQFKGARLFDMIDDFYRANF